LLFFPCGIAPKTTTTRQTNKRQDSRKAATKKPTANNSTIKGKNHPEITQDDEIISTSYANSTPQKKGQNVLNKIKNTNKPEYRNPASALQKEP
jgi:uncharacterized membrane protein